jgi:polyisoprenoid-binding protein YceI
MSATPGLPEPGRYILGPGSGALLLRTTRAGLAAKVGHDLLLEFATWAAEVDVPGADPAGVRVTAAVELDSLRVREGTGGAAPLTGSDRRDILRNAAKSLGGGTARYDADGVAVADGQGVLDGTLDLHGVAADLRLTVTAAGAGRYRARGAVTQSRHGIRPYSAFLGALRLADEVAVEVEVDLSRAQAPPAG